MNILSSYQGIVNFNFKGQLKENIIFLMFYFWGDFNWQNGQEGTLMMMMIFSR